MSKENILNFIEELQDKTGEDLNVCYQCKKCSAGCPIAYAMDYTPAQLMEAIRLGRRNLVLSSKTIWLCASCETCTTRCPQEIDISGVMDALRILARKEKVKPAIPEVSLFYDYVLASVRLFGCIYELAVGAFVKLKTKEVLKETPLSLELLKRKRLKIIPPFRDVFTINKIFKNIKRIERDLP